MLKIKNNVDLKELEKYGFKMCGDYIYKPKHNDWSVVELSIDGISRIIDTKGISDNYHTKDDTLYDLINDDLVEKVENKDE